MPYVIQKTSPKCWSVLNEKTGSVKAKCTSENKAKAQVRLLESIETETLEKSSDRTDQFGKKRGGEIYKKCSDKASKNTRETSVSKCFKRGLKVGYRIAKSFRPPLEDLTIRELGKLASEYKISGYSKMTKQQLITSLKDAGYVPTTSKKGKGTEEPLLESDTDEGGYLESLKRKSGLLPPSVRKMLEKIGNEKITKLKIVRTPLNTFTRSLLNLVSLGAYEKAVRDSPYDSMFHLALRINDKYTTDKQEVIKLNTTNPIKSNSETLDISVNKDVSINELFENGRKQMGDDAFTNYDPRQNNCQDFLLGLLKGSSLLTDEVSKFIKQDAEVVFKNIPSISEKISRFLTDVGAVAERVVEGEGVLQETWIMEGGRLVPVLIRKKQKNIIVKNKMPSVATSSDPRQVKRKIEEMTPSKMSWKEFVKKEMTGKKFKGRTAVNDFMKELSKKFKKI